MPNTGKMTFEVRLIFKNTRSIDMTKVAETAKDAFADLMRMNLKAIKLRKYGLLFEGEGPIPEILRIGEAVYPLTAEGGLEIIVHVGKNETFYMKEGCIHDLRDDSSRITIPKFDDAEPDESELDRIGL
ncbi:MAG: hypothetical protein ACM3PE_00835 [Deltaproteobacteria bacterium]